MSKVTMIEITYRNAGGETKALDVRYDTLPPDEIAVREWMSAATETIMRAIREDNPPVYGTARRWSDDVTRYGADVP